MNIVYKFRAERDVGDFEWSVMIADEDLGSASAYDLAISQVPAEAKDWNWKLIEKYSVPTSKIKQSSEENHPIANYSVVIRNGKLVFNVDNQYFTIDYSPDGVDPIPELRWMQSQLEHALDRLAHSEREWVELTDEDITTSRIYSETRDKGCFHAGARWAGKMLKMKNE